MHQRWIKTRKWTSRSLVSILRPLPLGLATRLVRMHGLLEYGLVPGLRSTLQQAVRREGQGVGDAWDVPRISRALCVNQTQSRIRDLLLDGRSPTETERQFRILGFDWLRDCFQENKGVILLGNHFGSNLLTAHWLIQKGYPWRMFGERPRLVSRVLARAFEIGGALGQDGLFISRRTNPGDSASAILRAARILRAGMALSIACDVRWRGPHTVPARFLGRTYSFSSTWVSLAALTGAPVVPVYCRIATDGTYQLSFTTPFQVPGSDRSGDRASAWVQHALDLLEQQVWDDPANSNDYFFWSDEPAEIASRVFEGARVSAA